MAVRAGSPKVVLSGTANLTTAHGIWQTAIGATTYVIVGGSRDGLGLNKGFVVGYDSARGSFSHLKFYSALNQPGLVTHFEGIAAASSAVLMGIHAMTGMKGVQSYAGTFV